MNIDVPRLVEAAVPESKGRNARIISQHNGANYRDRGFLSKDFPHSPPKLYLTAETDDFDEVTIAEWRDEGYDVEYIPMGAGGSEYRQTLVALSKKDMGPCESFGIIAYGEAAAFCLKHYHILDNNPDFKLSLLIAYYPTAIPDPKGRFPNSIRPLVHLAAGEEIGVVTQSQMVGIQGKKRVTRKTVDNGVGAGGVLSLAYPGYSYNAAPGFAEHDLDEYDGVSAELAWSRSLAAANQAFAKDGDLELTVEENVQGKFFDHDTHDTISTFATHKSPHVTYVPTLTGGTGTAELERFYSRFFHSPPSMELTLLSRTVGADRVVDEFHIWFKHTEEVPWMLPGIPPTNKPVEVLVVSIVALRAGKIYHEHVYWDQASVLVQIGLLDPRLGPVTAKKTGIEQLPITGREAARRVLRSWEDEENGAATNKMIPTWPGGASHDGVRKGGGARSGTDMHENEQTRGATKGGKANGSKPPSQKKLGKQPEQPQQQASEHETDGTTSKSATVEDAEENGT